MTQFANEYEIQEVVDRYQEPGLLYRAGQLLLRYVNAVNSCSDGWPYWAPASSKAWTLFWELKQRWAAKTLRDQVTVEMVKEWAKPIRDFVEKHSDKFVRFDGDFIDVLIDPPPAALIACPDMRRLIVEAGNVQNASNIMGVSKRFAAVVVELRDLLRLFGAPYDTDAIHRHPITQAWADKLASLAGVQSTAQAIAAHSALQELISECDNYEKQAEIASRN